jgi:hypothetical protein
LTAIQQWLLSLVVTAFAVVISYLWIDRPIALFVHVHIPGHEAFAQLTRITGAAITMVLSKFLMPSNIVCLRTKDRLSTHG